MAKVTNKAYADTYTRKYRFVAEEYGLTLRSLSMLARISAF